MKIIFFSTTFILFFCGSVFSQLPQQIIFDPDGSGPRPQIIVSSLDWKEGNALVKEHTRKPKKMLAPQDDFRMDLYYQTSLRAFIDESGKDIVAPGLNNEYEITMVAGFGQRGIREISDDGIRLAHTSCYANVNYLEIYFDETPDSNPLEGTGFNDGKLIYEGDVTASGVFIFPRDGIKAQNFDGNLPKIVEMDQFGTNQFPGVGTAVGSGRGALESAKKNIDTSFFLSDISRLLLRSQLEAPFTKVDPSKKFVTQPHGEKPKNIAKFGPSISLFKKGMSGIVDMQFQPNAYSTFEVNIN